jgi:MYXO-CTERM domain-containing protein
MYRVLFVAAVASFWVQAARADLILTAPAGLEPGQQFQIVFVTDGKTQATSTNISTYNSFVTNDADAQANGSVYYNGQLVTFSAIGSTSTVSATSNIGANSAPVYLADGTLIANSTTTGGLWFAYLGGGIYSGQLMAGIDEDLSGNHISPTLVWTGTMQDGNATATTELGSAIGAATIGITGATNGDWIHLGGSQTPNDLVMYGISDVLTVAGVPEPPEASSMLLTLMGLGAAFGWRLARRRKPAEQP